VPRSVSFLGQAISETFEKGEARSQAAPVSQLSMPGTLMKPRTKMEMTRR